jgi:hypothetical protein
VLLWSSSVWAEVYATNIYGHSETSTEGNGAVIIFYPDSPVSLTEDFSDRTISTVGFTWLDGADPGGVPVIDYRVIVTSSDGNYNLVETGLIVKEYKATGLTLGVTYSFTVESRNSHGYSNTTAEFGILCAIEPLDPTNLASVNSNDVVDSSLRSRFSNYGLSYLDLSQ